MALAAYPAASPINIGIRSNSLAPTNAAQVITTRKILVATSALMLSIGLEKSAFVTKIRGGTGLFA